MSETEIREAVVDDAEEIAGIHVRSFVSTYAHLPLTRHSAEKGLAERVEIWKGRLAAAGGRTLVAEEDGKIVGFVHLGPDPDDPQLGHIHSLHIDPEHTGRGIGARLVAAARDALVGDGYRTATLWAVADNDRTRSFYERLGWEHDGGRRRERLAVGHEEGDEVKVVRYRISLEKEDGRKSSSHHGDGAVPKYYEVRQYLRQHIDVLPPGTPVPPERTLSERFNISRTTVRQALHDLAVEGRIVRMQGRGTFVATPKVTQDMQLTSYTEDMLSQGMRPGSRLIDMSVIDAEAEVAERLEIEEGAPATRIERVRYANGEPMAVETVYLDPERFPGIVDLLDENASLYAILEKTYGVVPVQGEQTIETVLAPPAISRLLGTGSTTPMLMLSRTSRDADGRPIEYVRSLYRGDRFRLATRLFRPDR